MKKLGVVFAIIGVFSAIVIPIAVSNVKTDVTYGIAEMRDVKVGLELVGQTAAKKTKTVLCSTQGKVEKLNISEGDSVVAGENLAVISSAGDEQVAAVMSEVQLSDAFDMDVSELARTVGCDINVFNSLMSSEKDVSVFSPKEQSDTNVSSPISGKVINVGVMEDGYAAPGAAIAVIADTSDCIIEAMVYEDDIDSVYVGMPCRVTLEGKTESTTGKVSYISDAVTLMDGLKKQVRIEITPDVKIADILGRSADIELELNTVKDVIAVPCDAINDGNVFVINDGILEQRNVVLGLSDGMYTQIIDGISYLEKIVVFSEEELKEGMAVNCIDRA
ncbi:MAG: HlyD family efflux transporter periplasmic adaptor subunit [Christensenellaceae bacterium]|nr:HlyD family efflux transporter periplasmic adaptor subunit [Christensenellaceae bacterium]